MRLPFKPPGGDRTINALIFMAVGLWCFGGRFLPGGNWSNSVAGTLAVILGVGLWLWYPWMRWPAAAFLLSMAAFNFSMWFVLHRFTWVSVGANAAMVWVAWTVIRDGAEKKEDPQPPDEEKPLVSIVLLLVEPRHLEAAILARQISRAWGAEYVGKTQDGPSEVAPGSPDPRVVVGATPLFCANAPDGLYLIHNQPAPYWRDREGAAAGVPEPRIREALLNHQAWIAVDLQVPLAPARPIETYYPLIGRLIAELADEDCLAVFHPASLRMSAWDSSLEDVLRGPEPLNAFTVPVKHLT